MKRKSLSGIFLSIAIWVSVSSDAQSQTWVCDVREAVGFSGEQGYRSLNFTTDRSYIVRAPIIPNDLTFEFQRNHNVFSNAYDDVVPASIQAIGEQVVSLCIMVSYPVTSLVGASTRITCEGLSSDKFVFNLNTGRFSQVYTGFESETRSASWVEVGECRRTM